MTRPSFPASARARRALALLAAAVTLAAVTRPALAQDVALAPADSATTPATAPTVAGPTVAGPTVAGPTVAGAAVAAHAPRADRNVSNADARAALAPSRTHHGPAVALMLVGATAVVLGFVAGGDAETPLVVGGAIVGLIGLYQYLL